MSDFAAWEEIKTSANGDMKTQSYTQALEKYEDVISHLEAMSANEAMAIPEHAPMLLACLNNASMAYLRLERYEDVVAVCTRGINLDAGNLKARYRRAQAYYKLAHGECTPGQIRTTTTLAEADSDELWGLAMQDVQDLLGREPESTQTKALKQEIREARRDQKQQREHIQKYGDKYSMAAQKEKDKEKGYAKGSVFQEFPVLREEQSEGQPVYNGLAPDKTYSTTSGGDRAALETAYQTSVAKDDAGDCISGHGLDVLGDGSETTRVEMERQELVRKEQELRAAEAESSGGFSFLNPEWKPPDEPQQNMFLAPTTNFSSVVSPETKTGAPVSGGSSSMADLMRKAKKSKGKDIDAPKTKKKEEVSKDVELSLTALQAQEAAATERVERTTRQKEKAAAERTRGASHLSKKSEALLEEQERIKKAPSVNSAWSELIQGEKVAQNKYKKQLDSRNVPAKD